MPDAKPHTLQKPKKTVWWAEDVYITLNAEAAYAAATQGILVIPPPEAVAEPDEVQIPEAAATEEDNQSHLSDSEQEGNPEKPILKHSSPEVISSNKVGYSKFALWHVFQFHIQMEIFQITILWLNPSIL